MGLCVALVPSGHGSSVKLFVEELVAVTKGQWERCPGSWSSNGESVGGCGGGPLRLRQMGGSCLTMLEPTCCSNPMPPC